MENEEGQWINDDPLVKKFVQLAKRYYDGTVKFARKGVKTYVAKLDPKMLKIDDCEAAEAYFEINRVKCTGNVLKDVFVLRMIEAGDEINITLM